jgi:hypothetical protein
MIRVAPGQVRLQALLLSLHQLSVLLNNHPLPVWMPGEMLPSCRTPHTADTSPHACVHSIAQHTAVDGTPESEHTS